MGAGTTGTVVGTGGGVATFNVFADQLLSGPQQETFRTRVATGQNQWWSMWRNVTEIARFSNTNPSNSLTIQTMQPNGALWLRNAPLPNGNGGFRLAFDGNGSGGTFPLNGFVHNPIGWAQLGAVNGINTVNPWARLSLMHENMGASVPVTCFRPWFDNAVLGMGNSDLFYIGHKYAMTGVTGAEQDDNSNFVAAWGDPNLPAGLTHQFDNFQFRFLGASEAATSAGSIDGLELMRLRPFRLAAGDPVQGFVGIGDWSNTSPAQMPEERLDVLDRTMRLRGLPTATYQVTAGDWDRVMIVQNDGTVKWRSATTLGSGGGIGCDWTVTPPAQKQLLAAYVTPSGASCPEEDWRVSIGTVLGITSKFKVYGRRSVGGHGGAIQAEFQTTGTGVGGSGVSASVTHETAGTPITGDAIGVLSTVTDAGYRGSAVQGQLTVAGSGAETVYGLNGRLTLNGGSNTSVAAYGTASNVVAQQGSTANSVYGMYTTVTGAGSMNSVSGVSSLVNLGAGSITSSYGADATSQWGASTSLTNSTGMLAKSTNLTSTMVQKSIGADVSASGGSAQTLGVQASGYGEEVEGVPTVETKGVKSTALGPVLVATGVYGKGANYGFAFHRRVGVHGATFVSNSDLVSEHISILGEAAGNGAQQWAGLFESQVQIQGDLFHGTSNIFSDASLKTDVQDLGDMAGSLMAVIPHRYHFTDEARDRLHLPGGEQIGFVAQEMEEQFPQLVRSTIIMAKRDSVGHVIAPALEIKAVNYVGLVPVLVSGHQQQENRLAAVESQLAQVLEQLAACCANADGTRALAGGSVSGAALENDLRIVPNPVADRTELRYTVANEGRVRLEIADASSRVVLTREEGLRTEGSYIYEWDTTLLAPGTYFCTLYINDELLVKKSVKLGTR